ncbi:MAG: DUF2789 family protein [Rhodoferax sp.]|uniref:DUF2789 family protein n=1 Tax=Rhodoferax sp. TaxID=50421 RepID=UPI002627BB88|nr:DUF2789 family protein [Rhodoferax sp.]MDD5336646.1 DUF2789 family protein [Rhodoferax sp.]
MERFDVETNPHDLSRLLLQLGLPGGRGDIDTFVAKHRLRAGSAMPEASFWTPVQAKFLAQALADDSDWSAAVDELAVRLSQ